MILTAILFAATGYVIEARGDVSLHRRDASQASPASAGMEVHSGDTIRVTANAKVRILCPDLTTTWEPAALSANGVFERCPTSEVIRTRDEQQVLGVRTTERTPWVLMPSNTVLTTPTPVIRWEPAAGASRYRVSVSSNRKPVWGPALIEGTSIRYSGKQPLTTDVEYVIRVEAEGGVAADGKPFTIGSADVRAKMNEQMRHFEQTIPEKTAREIAMAIYLVNANLRADALTLLERLASTETSAALKLLYARCLGEVGDAGAQRDVLKRAVSEAHQLHDSYSAAEAVLELRKLGVQP